MDYQKNMDDYLSSFENLVNTKIIGNQFKPSQWRIPKHDQQGYLVGSITLNNRTTRKIINNLNDLIDLSIQDISLNYKWKSCINLYTKVIEVLRQKEDLTDSEIDDFQILADEFLKLWLELHGRDGVTNYFHMIGSGHLKYYLKIWRNLYRFSQKGWENMNSLIRRFYFRRTQKGGYTGKKDVTNSSKAVPIAKWIQRTLMWKTGYNK